MDLEELKKAVADYFDIEQLLDLLGLQTEDVVELLSDKIEENADMLEDYLNYGE